MGKYQSPVKWAHRMGAFLRASKVQILSFPTKKIIMQTIWKFETPFESNFSLEMPTQSEILSVQIDQKTNKPCIWALVYPDNPKEERFFELFGTGHKVPPCTSSTFFTPIPLPSVSFGTGKPRKFIGTYQYQLGDGHIFEVK